MSAGTTGEITGGFTMPDGSVPDIAYISIFTEDFGGPPEFISTDTGTFTYSLEPGSYRLRVSGEAGLYRNDYWGGGDCKYDADLVVVTAGEVTDVGTWSLRPLPTAGPVPAIPTIGPLEDWLGALSWWRATSGLAPVEEAPCWSRGIDLHGEYLSKTPWEHRTGIYADYHRENPDSPYYTPAGAEADSRSKQILAPRAGRSAIEFWLGVAPVHAFGSLNPDLRLAAFGGATTYAGLRTGGEGVYPGSQVVGTRKFPGAGSLIPQLDTRGNEIPNLLDSCSVGFTTDSVSDLESSPIMLWKLPVAPAATTRATLRFPDGSTVSGLVGRSVRGHGA